MHTEGWVKEITTAITEKKAQVNGIRLSKLSKTKKCIISWAFPFYAYKYINLKAHACESNGNPESNLQTSYWQLLTKEKLYRNIKKSRFLLYKSYWTQPIPPPFNLKDNGLDCAISAVHPLEQCKTNYWNYFSILLYYFSTAQYLLFKLL